MSNILTDDPKPVPPVQPDDGDCCSSGCDPCVFDRYAEAMEHYRTALRAWEQRHPGCTQQKN